MKDLTNGSKYFQDLKVGRYAPNPAKQDIANKRHDPTCATEQRLLQVVKRSVRALLGMDIFVKKAQDDLLIYYFRH